MIVCVVQDGCVHRGECHDSGVCLENKLPAGPALNVRRECTIDNTGDGSCLHAGACEKEGRCLEPRMLTPPGVTGFIGRHEYVAKAVAMSG